MKVRNLKYIVLIILVGVGFWWWWLIPRQQRIRPANVGTQSFSVSWWTDGFSKNCILAVPKKAINIKNWLYVCEKDKTVMHLVKLDKAKSETIYKIFIVSGLRVTFKDILEVKTKGFSDEPISLPQPAYGQIVNSDGGPVPGALVYLWPISQEFVYPMAVKTDSNGHYAVDIGEIKSKSEILMLEAVANAGIFNEIKVSSQYHEPLPSIVVAIK
ncbi:MAG: hypothetical protein ABIJ43_00040 [Candidatus Beckwithbacteria bacterium]|nr:hypothetical protein [Patescibacteria group bacterium]